MIETNYPLKSNSLNQLRVDIQDLIELIADNHASRVFHKDVSAFSIISHLDVFDLVAVEMDGVPLSHQIDFEEDVRTYLSKTKSMINDHYEH